MLPGRAGAQGACGVSGTGMPEPRSGEGLLHEQGLQVAMRIVATLRTGRSYAIGNQAFSRQLEQLLESLRPLLEQRGEVFVLAHDGDVHVNGARMPLRPASLRQLEQLVQEFQVRAIAGVAFRPGLTLAELEGFMRYFLPSEIYKGAELAHACATQGFACVLAIEADAPGAAPAPEAPADAAPADAASGATPSLARAWRNAALLLGGAPGPRALELRHLKRVSQPLVDAVLDEGAGAPSPPSSAPAVGWEHAARVALLSIAIGRRLGFARAELSELGVAALLHDCGQGAVAAQVRHPVAGRGPVERTEAENHTLEGLRQIALSSTLNATSLLAMRVALEHHAGGPGGHPSLPPEWRTATASRLVAIADAYVTLLERHAEGGPALAPSEALGRVLGPLAPGFPPALRAALVRVLGVHPPGQVLELDDGSLVRSLGGLPDDPARPRIERLTGPDGAPVAPGLAAGEPLPAERSVRRALPLAEWPPQARAA